MAHPDALQDHLSQLRSQVARLRQEAAAFRDRMDQAKAQLQPRADQARADREEATRQLRHDLQEGAVETADRALLARVVDGDTTWRDVMSGEDQHPTATAYRTRVSARVREAVDQLAESDDEFADDLEQTRRGDEATRRRA